MDIICRRGIFAVMHRSVHTLLFCFVLDSQHERRSHVEETQKGAGGQVQLGRDARNWQEVGEGGRAWRGRRSRCARKLKERAKGNRLTCVKLVQRNLYDYMYYLS